MKLQLFVNACLVVGISAVSSLALAKEVRELRGSVTGDDQPLANVLVSDGCRTVRTDSDGKYRLAVGDDSGAFVFATLPRGFWSEEFYVPIATATETGRADFQLARMNQPDRFDFVFMADMHLAARDASAAKFKASLSEMNRLLPAPVFLWAQGDICLQSGVGPLYEECCRVANMPLRHGAGNHEMLLKHSQPRDDFESRFGPTYYSFDWGPVHCIVLDGNKPISGQTGWQAVHGAVEGSELRWLKADLAEQPEGKPIVVGVHIPIVTSYPERRSTSPENAPYWETVNSDRLQRLFTRYRVRLVLQGHMHENERVTISGVEYVSSISISGCWWKSGAGFERGVDNSPRGYRIVSVAGNQITHRYQSSCESRVDRKGEFVGLERPVVADQRTEVVFNCYDAPNEAKAMGRVDDGPWRPMPPFAVPSPATGGLTMPHHFRLLLDTAALDAGAHKIAVRVEFPDGELVEESNDFSIAP